MSLILMENPFICFQVKFKEMYQFIVTIITLIGIKFCKFGINQFSDA